MPGLNGKAPEPGLAASAGETHWLDGSLSPIPSRLSLKLVSDMSTFVTLYSSVLKAQLPGMIAPSAGAAGVGTGLSGVAALLGPASGAALSDAVSSTASLAVSLAVGVAPGSGSDELNGRSPIASRMALPGAFSLSTR
jgi:hypothetical protein